MRVASVIYCDQVVCIYIYIHTIQLTKTKVWWNYRHLQWIQLPVWADFDITIHPQIILIYSSLWLNIFHTSTTFTGYLRNKHSPIIYVRSKACVRESSFPKRPCKRQYFHFRCLMMPGGLGPQLPWHWFNSREINETLVFRDVYIIRLGLSACIYIDDIHGCN